VCECVVVLHVASSSITLHPLDSGQPVCGFGEPGCVEPLPKEQASDAAPLSTSSGHSIALGLSSHQSEVFYDGLLMPIEAALQKSGAKHVRALIFLFLIFGFLLRCYKRRIYLSYMFVLCPRSFFLSFVVSFSDTQVKGHISERNANDRLVSILCLSRALPQLLLSSLDFVIQCSKTARSCSLTLLIPVYALGEPDTVTRLLRGLDTV